MVKPELVLLPAAALVAKQRWWVYGTSPAGGLTAPLVSLAVVGMQGFGQYIALNLEAARSYNPVQSERNLRGMLTWGLFVRWLGGGVLAEGLALALSGVSLLGLGRCWRGPWQPRGKRFGQQWALTLPVSVLVAPHVYLPTLILAVLGAALILRGIADDSSEPDFGSVPGER